MTEYSDIVYRCPGPYQRPHGTFDFRGVTSKVDHEQALKDGWFNTLPEAIEGKASLIELPAAEAVDNSPPTREELEQQAKELGIKFYKRTSDEVLSKKIDDALGA